MAAPGLDDFTYLLLGTESLQGKSCHKIQSIPVNEDLMDEYGYSKSVSWVDENSFLVYQIHYYDFDGDLYKTITNSDFRELDRDKYMVTGMKAVNHQNNRRSDMIMEQVSVTSTKESYFSVAYLEKE
jgi:hypothetical protein